jgi:eukaryotic-like serine/threonine-protein kinase
MDKSLIDKRYELGDLVGSGGMADVYLAHDEVLDRDVAFKLLKAQYAQNEEFVERFRREARSAASLSHPHIVPIFDWGETGDGTYYIAMEYLSGGTLRDHLISKGALPARTATAAVVEIAEALRAAHEQGIIHRDIKPRNILITDSGHVKVTDFGIARAAEATTISDLGDILGSVKYMSPEQAMGERVGPASDLYSLGVLLYEMLTGRVPYEVATPAEVSEKHAVGELPPHPKEINPEVPESMDALVMKLLAREPQERYGGAAELIEDLRRVRDGLSPVVLSGDDAATVALERPAAPTLPAPAPGGTEVRRRRKWSLIMAASTLLALLGAVGGALGWNSLRDPGAASIPEILTSAPGDLSLGAKHKPSRPEEVGGPSVEGSTGQEARERLAEAGLEAVPNLVGLSYPEAENALEESGFLLGGVKEAPSESVPEGVIIKQNPQSGTTLDAGSYVYLTTSVGPPEPSSVSGRQASGVTSSQHYSSSKALRSEEAAPSGADVLPVRKENKPPSHLVRVIQSKIHHGVESLLGRVSGGGKDPHRVVAQESQYGVPKQ